ncbi:MAG: hypothetical protein ACFFEY_03490 [Candidatus Thorarchaeota archaeon]
MSTYLKKFDFEKSPMNITYLEKAPLKLNNKFIFFHNKSKFRKELTRLQILFNSYINTTLHAAAIRDSYLKENFFENYLIVLFTETEKMKKVNEIIEKHTNTVLNSGCFLIENNDNYMLLLSRDIDGLRSGIDAMETILKQVLEDYLNQKIFDDYIKICAFTLMDCIKK